MARPLGSKTTNISLITSIPFLYNELKSFPISWNIHYHKSIPYISGQMNSPSKSIPTSISLFLHSLQVESKRYVSSHLNYSTQIMLAFSHSLSCLLFLYFNLSSSTKLFSSIITYSWFYLLLFFFNFPLDLIASVSPDSFLLMLKLTL